MRRGKQQIPDEEVKEILHNTTSGALSLVDPEGKPYCVPLSFIYDGENSIYFHCAPVGRKIDCIRHNPYACFTIIDKDDIQPEAFTTYFKSVIIEGKISVMTDIEEIRNVLRILSSKYSPGINCENEIAKSIDRIAILKMTIFCMTGKEAIELTRRRTQCS